MFTFNLSRSVIRQSAVRQSAPFQYVHRYYSAKNMPGLGLEKVIEDEAADGLTEAKKKPLVPSVTRERFENLTSQQQTDLVREVFVKQNEHQPRTYLGYDLSRSPFNFKISLAEKLNNFQERFLISPNVPTGYSDLAADLWTRIENSFIHIRKVSWLDLSDSVGYYDEMFNCKVQFERDSASFTEEERSTLSEKLKQLEAYWELAKRVNGISGILNDLKAKYKNDFVYPEEDIELLVAIVEEHFALVNRIQKEKVFSGDTVRLKNKLEDAILMNVSFLKERMIIPELSYKYPALFK